MSGDGDSPATVDERPPGKPAKPVRASRHRQRELPVVDPGHYEILDEYARGGLGRIVRARDLRTGRVVAIKEMLAPEDDSEAPPDTETAERFVREARVTANLQHPSIVPVHEIGRWPSGAPFYAMKLVAGRSLQQVLDDAPTPAARLAQLGSVIAVADALAYAHGQRVIHRDLKPANVLVGDFGETVVIDWGLAKLIDDDDDHDHAAGDPAGPRTSLAIPSGAHTIDGTVLGTPYYMAPEQARGVAADERADVYAIGAMLYQLITGDPPFYDQRPANLAALSVLMEASAPTAVAKLAPSAPPDLVAIVSKAMARSPADRYPTARELADDLRRFTHGQLVGAYRYDRRTLVLRWMRRHRTAVTCAVALIAILAVGSIVSVRRILQERDETRVQSRAAMVARDEAALQTHRARVGLAEALYEKGRTAEGEQRWAIAGLYYAAARVQDDTPAARWAAGLAEARAIVPHARHVGHDANVTAAAISGDRAATVDDGGHLHVWSIADGALRAERTLPEKLSAVAFSPDGTELAVGGGAGVVHRYALDLSPRGELIGHTGRIYTLAYSRTGLLASGSADKTIRLWTLATGESRVLTGHHEEVVSVAFSPDDKRLVSGSDDRSVWLWDVATGAGKPRGTHVGGGVTAVAFSASGTQVLSVGWDFGLHLWTGDEGAADLWFDSHSVHAVALSPDARVAITGGDMTEIHVWELSTHKVIASLPAPGRTSAIALSADGRWLVTAGQTHTPIVWDLAALPRLVDSVGHRATIVGIAFSDDGTHFVTGSDDKTIRIWDAATGDASGLIATTPSCVNPKLVGDTGVVVASCDDSTVRKWDAAGHEVARLATDVWLRFSTLSPDRRTLAVGHLNGRGALVDVATWKLVVERTLHAHQIYDLAYARSGELVTTGLDGTVRLWGPDLVRTATFTTTTDAGAMSAAMSPDGALVVAGNQDGRLDAWNAKTGAVLASPTAHSAAIWYVRFAPDSAHAYTASEDGRVLEWDTASWKVTRTLDAGEGAAVALAVSPDGKLLVSGHRSGATVIWDVPSGTPRQRIGGSARDHGSCQDFATQKWVDDAHRAIVMAACTSEPAAYLKSYAERTHLHLRGTVDVESEW